VTIGERMRQAEAAGAQPALVAAALLHDVGHLLGEMENGPAGGGVGGGGGSSPAMRTEAKHGEAGARWLSQWFGEAVTEPVRLHVAAKRYLCAVDAGYFGCCRPNRSAPCRCRVAR
jgi:gamma-butyrobetaine dioxygenase